MLYKLLKGKYIVYLAAIIAINISALFSIAFPLVLKTTLDSIIGNEPMNLPKWFLSLVEYLGGRTTLSKNLWFISIIIVLLTIGQGVFMFLKGKWAALAAESAGKNLRERIFDHLQHLPYEYHVKVKTGDLIQRCTSDIETILNFISNKFVDIGQIVFKSVYVLVIMFSLNTRYALYSTALIPVVFVITIVFFNSMKKIFRFADEAESRMSSTLQENVTGIRVVKAFGKENYEIEKFDDKNREYKERVYGIVRLMSNFWSSTDFISLTQLLIVIVLGTYWASKEIITVGTLVAFLSYIGMLLWPIRQLGEILAFAGQAFVSASRIQEILDQKIEFDPNDRLTPDIKGEIEFKNVSFSYDENNKVLNDISFKVNKGQTVAILGPTGSGKSSLVHLLVRLYDYQKGSINIDGVELRNIDKKWLRSKIGIVLQEPFLFSKTIKENISLAKSNIDESEIYEATSIAAVHQAIEEFEKGYDTLVGERGVTLSGGQKQRIAIARTIIANCPILIFDDSLSAVDIETDAAIRKALNEKSKDTTTFIISHRITTLAEADVIYVLENGSIVQQGKHGELINTDGLYKRIWEIQNSLEDDLEDVS